MGVWRYPVLLVRDRDGFVTGILAGCAWRGESAIGETPKEVLRQLRAAILQAKGDEHPGAPWFDDCRLEVITVSVRPRVVDAGREYPVQGPIPFRTACLMGKVGDSFHSCEVPQIGVTFDVLESGELHELASRSVRARLDAATPAEVVRLLHAKSFELGEVRVPEPRDAAAAEERARHTRELARVADPIPSRGLRAPSTAAFGREELAAAMVGRLVEARANLLLVGPPGTGKTSLLLHAAAAAEAKMDRPAGAPAVPRFWWTSGARLVAGMAYLGEWEARCDRIVEELQGFDGYLCIENLMGLVRAAGGPPEAGPGGYLQDAMRRGSLRMIAEATPEELDACRRLLPALAGRFETIPVPPLERATVLSILERVARDRGARSRRALAPGTLERVHALFSRFRPYEVLPGPAVGFLARLLEGAGGLVRADDAVAAFARDTGLPDLFLRDEQPLDAATVEAWFRERVLGQEEACREAAGVVTVFKAGLVDPRRPAACLLFAGPTGVGKTEMAKSLARFFFGSGEFADERLVRLDMSEYAGPDAAARLLGDPDGRPGTLIERVRRQPFCVVLLDEIEKAAEEVFDAVLGLLDEGRLTDAHGRVTWFRSAVVVLTSNLGGAEGESMGFARDRAPDYEAHVRRFFRPEFFNRLDRVVRFRPLSPEAVEAITRKELAGVARRDGVAKRGLRLTWSERLVGAVAAAGFDPRYGARPLQRAIEDAVVGPLGRWLLAHPGVRDTTLAADWDGAAAVFLRG